MTGIRGATTARENTKEAILDAAAELIRAVLDANHIENEQIIDIIFTATKDLTAVYPAAAARALGITSAGLMCMQEMDVDSSLRRCIRLLMHVEQSKTQKEMKHIYLRDAVVLRPDVNPGFFAVAIDGPSGSGKSTVAKSVAGTLNMVYVDTGAMYRAVALYNIRKGADVKDRQAVERSLEEIDITLQHSNGLQRLLLNSEDVTEALRTQDVAEGASIVASYQAVRDKLVILQQAASRRCEVVMDGRDIGTRVLPWAQVKIYLDASLEERINRRMHELREKGLQPEYETIRTEIEIRDDRDMNRAFWPLTRCADAIYIDTSDMATEQVTEKILQIIKEKRIPHKA